MTKQTLGSFVVVAQPRSHSTVSRATPSALCAGQTVARSCPRDWPTESNGERASRREHPGEIAGTLADWHILSADPFRPRVSRSADIGVDQALLFCAPQLHPASFSRSPQHPSTGLLNDACCMHVPARHVGRGGDYVEFATFHEEVVQRASDLVAMCRGVQVDEVSDTPGRLGRSGDRYVEDDGR
jgi:hypothetical protein